MKDHDKPSYAERGAKAFQALVINVQVLRAEQKLMRISAERICGTSLDGWSDEDVERYVDLGLATYADYIAFHKLTVILEALK